tara:strand:- start:471 stop:737 length:267 start_codon:yes stop_codon:yes gene_type:complete
LDLETTICSPPQAKSNLTVNGQLAAGLPIDIVTENIPVIVGLEKQSQPQAGTSDNNKQDRCNNKQCFPERFHWMTDPPDWARGNAQAV